MVSDRERYTSTLKWSVYLGFDDKIFWFISSGVVPVKGKRPATKEKSN